MTTENANSGPRRATKEETKVLVFFYGSFMNRKVLAEGGCLPGRIEVARLFGFDVQTQPLVTLARSDHDCVYGILCEASHEELARLYGQEWVKAYVPEPVVVMALDGRLVPALCYIDPPRLPVKPERAYLERVVAPARELAFPAWYVARLERLHAEGSTTHP